MTEERIFEILLKTKSSFPSLQQNLVEKVAGNFAETISNTLKLKSAAANDTRQNILRFIQNLATTNALQHLQINETNREIFLENLSVVYDDDHDFSDFVFKIPSKKEEILSFIGRKNSRNKAIADRLDYIKNMDQKNLNKIKLDFKVRKKLPDYESDQIIDKIINGKVENKEPPTSNEYREKQVKFGYALINLNKNELLAKLINKLGTYSKLNNLEIDFLITLIKSNNFELKIVEKFPNIIEKSVIKLCTEILQLHNENEVENFFSNYEKWLWIQKLCQNYPELGSRVANLVYELYFYGYCNENLLNFRNLLTN